jgi:GNAT superfamily N-acetyltransferase
MTLTIREATAADYPLFARLFPELAVPDPVPSSEAFATKMLPHVLVGLEGGADAGYAFFQLYGTTAHVVHLVVDPARRGRRIGEAMLADVRARAKAAGCTRAYLNVKRENASAIRLYVRCGFREEGTAWSLRVPWSIADGLDRDASTTAFVPAPSADAAIAERFNIPCERLALLRRRAGVAFMALRREGETVAFASFDPAYPGAYPFRAVGGELTGSLLAALRPFADHARFDFLHAAVEDDASVVQVLVSAGAEVLHEVTRMSTSL